MILNNRFMTGCEDAIWPKTRGKKKLSEVVSRPICFWMKIRQYISCDIYISVYWNRLDSIELQFGAGKRPHNF